MGGAHHCSGPPVSEMTYTVSSGTLNPSIPYHTLFIQSRFWTTYTNFYNSCLRYIASCGKKFYIGAHLHSWLYTTAVEFSSNLSAIYMKWCAQTFPPIFGLFAIFDGNYSKIVAPLSDGNNSCLATLKGQSLLKK